MKKALQFTLLGLFSLCAAAVLTGHSHSVLIDSSVGWNIQHITMPYHLYKKR